MTPNDGDLTIDTTFDERLALLERDLDGDLGAAERATLAARLDADPVLAGERRARRRLHALLAESAIAVRPGFREAVMAGLPVAPWERRRAAGWLPALAVALVLAVAAAVVLALSGGLAETPLGGAATAVADLVATARVAGAGLLGASWRGVGLGLEQLFAGSKTTLAAFAVLVVLVDLLFLALLRRRRPIAARPVAARETSAESDE